MPYSSIISGSMSFGVHSSYMRGRLTFDKVNIAVNEIATLADANSQLITAPKKKV